MDNEVVVVLPDMEPWQKDVFNYYQENDKDKWIVIKSVRQCGKSILAQFLLVAASIKSPNSVSILVSPVLQQAKKIYDEISLMCKDILSRANGSSLELTFINNSKILFKSAEQGDTIRGNTCKKSGILVVDEAAYINDDLFYSILVPTTNVFHNDIFLFSTPRFTNGLFYDLFNDGLSQKGKCISFDWCKYDLTKYLNEETLEIYRKRMPKNAFRAEYLGEWITGEGSVFNNFKNCVNNVKIDKKGQLVVGIDWSTGSGGDDTVLTSGQLIDNKIQVQNIISFNDKNANETIDLILDFIDQKVKDGFKEITLVVEKNSIGKVFGDILRERLVQYEDKYNDVSWRDQIRLSMQYFVTSNKTKETIIKELCVCFEQGLIVIPDNDKLMMQLTMYEVKVSSAGNLIYNAPNQNDAHDDYVMSLAFMINYLYKQIDR